MTEMMIVDTDLHQENDTMTRRMMMMALTDLKIALMMMTVKTIKTGLVDESSTEIDTMKETDIDLTTTIVSYGIPTEKETADHTTIEDLMKDTLQDMRIHIRGMIMDIQGIGDRCRLMMMGMEDMDRLRAEDLMKGELTLILVRFCYDILLDMFLWLG